MSARDPSPDPGDDRRRFDVEDLNLLRLLDVNLKIVPAGSEPSKIDERAECLRSGGFDDLLWPLDLYHHARWRQLALQTRRQVAQPDGDAVNRPLDVNRPNVDRDRRLARRRQSQPW